MTSDYQPIVDAFVDAMFVRHDPQAAAELYTDDARYWEPVLPAPITGRQTIAEYLAGFVTAFPDLSAQVTNLFGSGDSFAAELTVHGTNTGPLELEPGQTIDPTGRPVELQVCWIGRTNSEGRFTEDRTYYDVASFMQQLGLAGD